MIRKLMFRLLPVQTLLAAVGAVNGIVSGLFASNYVGTSAMTAVGLYGPINMFLSAVSMMLVGGTAILCGEYLGSGDKKKLNNVYSLDIVMSVIIGVIFLALLIIIGGFDLTGFFTNDASVRPLFNSYLIGQAIGIPFLLAGNQFAAFLLIENNGRRTLFSTIVYIILNIVFNYIFLVVMDLEALGLALASSLGMIVFCCLEASYFVSGKSLLKFSAKHLDWSDLRSVSRIGLPGALINGYQTIRALAVNSLLTAYVGSVGISAFTAANNLLALVWGLPLGMVAISRILMGISIGEEDRNTLIEVMRVVVRWFIPLMIAIDIVIAFAAVPLTRLYYQDPSELVFMMTVWGFRILPFCMPLSILIMHLVCYGQASGKNALVHVVSVLDGAVTVIVFTALLIPFMGVRSVYLANVISSVVSTLVLLLYSCMKNHRFPRNIGEMMVIPQGFGASEDQRINISVRSMSDVTNLSERVGKFCTERQIEHRRSFLAGLALEEMAGNVIKHGFTRDTKAHTIDVRVVCKDDKVILCLRDDCIEFDPEVRFRLADPEDRTANIGLRMVFGMSKAVHYQNILGLNVLIIHI